MEISKLTFGKLVSLFSFLLRQNIFGDSEKQTISENVNKIYHNYYESKNEV